MYRVVVFTEQDELGFSSSRGAFEGSLGPRFSPHTLFPAPKPGKLQRSDVRIEAVRLFRRTAATIAASADHDRLLEVGGGGGMAMTDVDVNSKLLFDLDRAVAASLADFELGYGFGGGSPPPGAVVDADEKAVGVGVPDSSGPVASAEAAFSSPVPRAEKNKKKKAKRLLDESSWKEEQPAFGGAASTTAKSGSDESRFAEVGCGSADALAKEQHGVTLLEQCRTASPFGVSPSSSAAQVGDTEKLAFQQTPQMATHQVVAGLSGSAPAQTSRHQRQVTSPAQLLPVPGQTAQQLGASVASGWGAYESVFASTDQGEVLLTAVLPWERTAALFLFAFPPDIDLETFLDLQSEGAQEYRIFHARGDEVAGDRRIKSAVFFFSSQRKADAFYQRNHGRLFYPEGATPTATNSGIAAAPASSGKGDSSTAAPTLQFEFRQACSYFVFVESVQYRSSKHGPGVSPTKAIEFPEDEEGRWGPEHCFELPACPYCLERLDVSVSGVVCHAQGWLSVYQWYEVPNLVSNCRACAQLLAVSSAAGDGTPPAACRQCATAARLAIKQRSLRGSTSTFAFETEMVDTTHDALIAQQALDEDDAAADMKICGEVIDDDDLSSRPGQQSQSFFTLEQHVGGETSTSLIQAQQATGRSSLLPSGAAGASPGPDDRWLCLVCGFLGCGRYAKGQHSLLHGIESGHRFCLELKSGRIWDYAQDVFVHRRLVQCFAAASGGLDIAFPDMQPDPASGNAGASGAEVGMAAVNQGMAAELDLLLTANLDHQRKRYEEQCRRLLQEEHVICTAFEREEAELESKIRKQRDATDQTARLVQLMQKKCHDVEEKLKAEREDLELAEAAAAAPADMPEPEPEQESAYVKTLRKEIEDLIAKLTVDD